MKRDFHAFTPSSPTPVRTFSDRDLAQQYKQDMEAIGSTIVIKQVVVAQRRAA